MSGLAQFAGRWFVLKIGGELASDPLRLASGVGQAAAAFLSAGIKLVIVHGAGPQATRLGERLGLKAVKVSGRRVTDEATLEVMKMALAGQVSVDIAAALRRAGVAAISTTGISAALIDARRRPPVVVSGGGSAPIDFGWVGDVVRVNVELLEQLARIPVVVALASLAADAKGNVFNINADTVAARVAAALRASKLFLVSGLSGVLQDVGDATTRIPRLDAGSARAQIAAGVIRGGMIPKVEEGLAALDAGVESVHIVGCEPPDCLLQEALRPGSCGTAIGDLGRS